MEMHVSQSEVKFLYLHIEKSILLFIKISKTL